MTKPMDRRVRKTQTAFRNSLIALMAQKSIRDISVQELADLADLNRATFYLHYKDIYELQQQVEDEIIGEINAILEAHMMTENETPQALFIALLGYIQKNSDLCDLLLGEHNNRSFLDKLCQIVADRCLSVWQSVYKTKEIAEEIAYFNSYTVYGYVAAIARWVRTGSALPPEQLAQLLGNMGVYGVGFLDRLESKQ